ncbi:hypothetical protein D7223_16630 [Micromonospora endolithica]|uniref:Uncharacterized protein n=1 Tax=Micromonospora endolithica TaxID=230091 RepID=A0A3A9Z9R0_9ACTN|nr:hypothetical protein D7223_16630 [Micromonospora endolithica]
MVAGPSERCATAQTLHRAADRAGGDRPLRAGARRRGPRVGSDGCARLAATAGRAHPRRHGDRCRRHRHAGAGRRTGGSGGVPGQGRRRGRGTARARRSCLGGSVGLAAARRMDSDGASLRAGDFARVP